MARRPKKLDVDLVRSAARGRWPDISRSIFGIDDEFLTGQHGPCPKCGGSDRWRVFDDFRETGGAICNQCGKDLGDGFALAQWALGVKFGPALERIAKYLGIDPSSNGHASNGHAKSKAASDPEENLAFLDWHNGLAETWCALHKPGVSPAGMLACGARRARYRDQHNVFAIPVWGRELAAAKPVGWLLYSISGGLLPKFNKESVEWLSLKLTAGSKPGLIGPVDRLADATLIVKLEGGSDAMAFASLELPTGVVGITNANGAKQKPLESIAELFTGKPCWVAHDPDKAGQEGALGREDRLGKHHPGWVEAIAAKASECRNILLPCKDLREYVIAGHGFDDLKALADCVTPAAAVEIKVEPIEAEDDPHRLSKINLDRYASMSPGATIRFWRDEFYTWKQSRGCYRRIGKTEFLARLNTAIKEEFDRINIAKQADWHERAKADLLSEKEQNDGPPKAQKVTSWMVNAVADATRGMTIIPSSVELMTWLPDRDRPDSGQRNYVAVKNGLLDIDAFMADSDECLLPHSANWFSVACLPYDFDPKAECPLWNRFLNNNLECDVKRIDMLQEWAGHLLLPDTGQQKFLLMHGEGSNGKSVFFAGLTAMLGEENISNIPLETFGDRFSRTDTLGKLANVAGDCEELDKVAEGYIKSFTSGDRMFFDRKGVSGVSCVPTARLMVSCNELPRFRDRSRGIWRRMLLMPWLVEVKDHQKVRNMDKAEWWRRSGELPGILNWAILGLNRLRKQGGFTSSAVSESAIEDYQVEMNTARAFLKQFVTQNDCQRRDVIRADFLFGHYVRWVKSGNHLPFSRSLFGKEVARVLKKAWKVRKREESSIGAGDRHYAYCNVRFNCEKICGESTHDEIKFTNEEVGEDA